jgi:hypothetical protein
MRLVAWLERNGKRPFGVGMNMSLGGVSAALPVSTSAAGSGDTNDVQLQASISMQKKAQDLVAEQARMLIASATGVGGNLDVRG